ncbi:hypothetical protein TRL7639_03692 [Falsiruegeria litorea R37]|uniref:Uncharacterized protein n=1 Tax=Falsiruegeria litorea R37 TaxID=1200284 RepID=A0A1Y5TJI7_9RHOB|nr:hypothetical protein [Falsiruegeria litorea]SLN65461.1 hypothetical protein TRL7639_03692 [Falsiruegeria litorea R37]
MRNPLHIRKGEQRVLRLFSLDMRPEEARFLQEPGAAAQVLGLAAVDDEQVEVFPVSDLEEVGLYGYLSDGCGVDPAQLDKLALDAAQGWVLLVRSKAFEGKEGALSPDEGISLIGIYTEDGTDWSAAPIQTESAAPYSAAPPASDAEARRTRQIVLTFVVGLTLVITLVLLKVLL